MIGIHIFKFHNALSLLFAADGHIRMLRPEMLDEPASLLFGADGHIRRLRLPSRSLRPIRSRRPHSRSLRPIHSPIPHSRGLHPRAHSTTPTGLLILLLHHILRLSTEEGTVSPLCLPLHRSLRLMLIIRRTAPRCRIHSHLSLSLHLVILGPHLADRLVITVHILGLFLPPLLPQGLVPPESVESRLVLIGIILLRWDGTVAMDGSRRLLCICRIICDIYIFVRESYDYISDFYFDIFILSYDIF